MFWLRKPPSPDPQTDPAVLDALLEDEKLRFSVEIMRILLSLNLVDFDSPEAVTDAVIQVGTEPGDAPLMVLLIARARQLEREAAV